MGRYFEEFTVGEKFETAARTITETDIVQFAGLTGDFNPLHTDEVFSSRTMFGGRIAHGPMLVGMSFGLLGRLDLIDGTAMALKGLEWSFHAPVRPGDTVRVLAEVEDRQESARHPDRGRVRFRIEIVNQSDVVVQRGHADVIIRRVPDDGQRLPI